MQQRGNHTFTDLGEKNEGQEIVTNITTSAATVGQSDAKIPKNEKTKPCLKDEFSSPF